MHEGSAQGSLIWEVVAHVRKLLKRWDSDPKAKLLCFSLSQDGSQHWRETPADWNGTENHDHYENTFCMCVPVSVRYSTSRLFTPYFAD